MTHGDRSEKSRTNFCFFSIEIAARQYMRFRDFAACQRESHWRRLRKQILEFFELFHQLIVSFAIFRKWFQVIVNVLVCDKQTSFTKRK